jgi:hypothetical protein
MILSKFKERAGWLITLFAAMLAVNSILDSGNSSQILDDTIEANNVWAFYQAKSIKQNLTEMRYDDAIARKDTKKAEVLKAKIDRYESDPKTGEGKKELMAKARALEDDRANCELRSPWYTFSNACFQIAIVIMAAAMISFGLRMYWISIGVGILATILMCQGFWLFLPITL